MEITNYNKFCLLCKKVFATEKNLKRHISYAHKLCDPPAYVCDFCHTGFVRWDDYETHHSERLMKTFSRKTKKRKVKSANQSPPSEEVDMPEIVATAKNPEDKNLDIESIVNNCIKTAADEDNK